MRTPVYTRQFSKDIKRLGRRKKDLEKLKIIVRALVAGDPLDPIHRDHKLVGNYQGRRECHIESDWMLIYKLHGDSVLFERSGSRSDLFRK